MRRRFALLLFALLLLTGVFGFSQEDAKKPDSPAPSAASAPSASPAPAMDKDQCLTCHGPYAKLIEATSKYTAPSGEIVTPHQYVPHDEKKDVPDCTNCHTPHAIPPPTDVSLTAKPKNIDWCYTGCHHTQTLQNCNACH